MVLKHENMNAREIIDRMKKALGKKTDTELSQVLDISNKNISSWKSRNSVPMSAIVTVSFATSTSSEYILTGVMPSVNHLQIGIDADITEIIGERIFQSILSEYAKEYLVFMKPEEIEKKGKFIGGYIRYNIELLRKKRKSLVDEGGLSIEQFKDFEREDYNIPSEAIHLRERLKKKE